MIEDSNEKCGGLPGAGLRLRRHVLAGKCLCKSFRLNGSAVLKLEVMHCVQDFLRQSVVLKSCFAFDNGDRESRTVPRLGGEPGTPRVTSFIFFAGFSFSLFSRTMSAGRPMAC